MGCTVCLKFNDYWAFINNCQLLYPKDHFALCSPFFSLFLKTYPHRIHYVGLVLDFSEYSAVFWKIFSDLPSNSKIPYLAVSKSMVPKLRNPVTLTCLIKFTGPQNILSIWGEHSKTQHSVVGRHCAVTLRQLSFNIPFDEVMSFVVMIKSKYHTQSMWNRKWGWSDPILIYSLKSCAVPTRCTYFIH